MKTGYAGNWDFEAVNNQVRCEIYKEEVWITDNNMEDDVKYKHARQE